MLVQLNTQQTYKPNFQAARYGKLNPKISQTTRDCVNAIDEIFDIYTGRSSEGGVFRKVLIPPPEYRHYDELLSMKLVGSKDKGYTDRAELIVSKECGGGTNIRLYLGKTLRYTKHDTPMGCDYIEYNSCGGPYRNAETFELNGEFCEKKDTNWLEVFEQYLGIFAGKKPNK